MTSIAFEMAAVFLLAALLMFGSAHSLIPRSLGNAGGPVVVGALLLAFLIWRFWPDLYATARSNAAPWLAAPSPAATAPAPAQPSPSQPAPAAKALALRPASPVAAPGVKGIVIREVLPATIEPAPPAAALIVEKPAAAASIDESQSPRNPAPQNQAATRQSLRRNPPITRLTTAA